MIDLNDMQLIDYLNIFQDGVNGICLGYVTRSDPLPLPMADDLSTNNETTDLEMIVTMPHAA